MTHKHVYAPHPRREWRGHYYCVVCGFAIPGNMLATALKQGATLKETGHVK